eukprot:12718804-Ditylum_brightwellii.AAC.1
MKPVGTSLHQCYTAYKLSYTKYLDTDFDGTLNGMSIIGQMIAAEVSDNECHTLKEMLQQLDRASFIEAMYKEVKLMFDNNVWEKLLRNKMHVYYKDLKRQGINLERQQLVLILSFKRKRLADGLLSKHKAMLCCPVGHQ